jgi:outer membrane protein assembly factor BamA
MASCYPTRNVPADSYLYLKNSYKIKNGKIESHDINSYFKQKTNSKVLVIRPYTWFYDIGTIFKDSSKVYNFFTKSIGEAPILYDTSLVDPTMENISQHLKNLGYYNASISAKIITKKYLKTAKVKYIIIPNEPYRINKFSFDIENRTVKSFVLADWGKSLLDTGMIFSISELQKERNRISEQLGNEGFYYFNKNQISFIADTNLNSHKVNVTLKIEEQEARKNLTDTATKSIKDVQYKYRKIYIIPEVSDISSGEKIDTTVYSYDYDHRGMVDYYFIHTRDLVVNPKTILQALFIKPNRFYKKIDLSQTYKALSNLSIYKYVNINLHDLKQQVDGYGLLDCYVRLSKMSKYDIVSNSEVKNTGGQLGLEQNFGLISRNTFRNGEVLRVNLRGALEVQSVTNSDNPPNTILKIFNTFEAGINTSLEIPRFFAPVRRNFFSRYFTPKTIFNLGYNYQDRPDYTRLILNGTFGYKWVSNIKTSHVYNPVELSSVKIFPTPEFQETIDAYADPRIKYSYQDHLVLGMSYSYLYNEKKINSKKPFKFFFGKIELGGIPYSLISTVFGNPKDSLGQHFIGNLPYTQFARGELDFRYNLPANNGKTMHVFRINLGLGVPLGGSVAIPFEKSFYIGGANSLRGWTLGTLGPGSYNSGSTSFEMTGDIKIEMNYEFRFPISEPLMGAVFTDVGNIFLIRESDVMPGGEFKFNNFYNKLAVDFGYGLRYDMNFLIIRFDIAHPIYQPYLPYGNRWTMLSQGVDPRLLIAFNFAIGYPF